MDLNRALLFWEPKPGPADSMPNLFDSRHLPPRRMTLSDLERISEAMGRAAGTGSGRADLLRQSTVPFVGNAELRPPEVASWTDLSNAVPADRIGYELVARGKTVSAADPSVFPHATPETDQLILSIGDGSGTPASIRSRGSVHASLDALVAEWSHLGEARHIPIARYPALFLLAVAAAVAPIVALWVQGRLSLLTIPLVLLLIAVSFAVGAPRIQDRVRTHRRATVGLEIDFRLLDRIRLDKAATRRLLVQNISSGALGAIGGALLTVWLG